MTKVKITQAKSTIDAEQNVKNALCALRLRKTNQSVVRESTDTTLGTVCAVHHLVTVEEIG